LALYNVSLGFKLIRPGTQGRIKVVEGVKEKTKRKRGSIRQIISKAFVDFSLIKKEHTRPRCETNGGESKRFVHKTWKNTQIQTLGINNVKKTVDSLNFRELNSRKKRGGMTCDAASRYSPTQQR